MSNAPGTLNPPNPLPPPNPPSPPLLPMPSPPRTETAYNNLLTALHPLPTSPPLELAILPPSHPPLIHYTPSPPSLALPRTLLIPLYLHARQILTRHLSPAPPLSPQTSTSTFKTEIETDAAAAALQATTVILLWDPNHITATNFRKRYIQSRCGYGDEERGRDMVRCEMWFLETMLTSPLDGHAKSWMLWGHRWWMLRRFGAAAGNEGVLGLWEREIGVVMRAGERHARNYYAWEYARWVVSFVEREMGGGGVEWEWLGMGMGMGRVHGWCLMHPRDVSGWGFLVFLMRRVVGEGRWGEGEVGRVVWETREWVRKYEWRGESVEWFLKAVGQLQLG